MPDSFQKKSDFEEKDRFADYPQIVSLTDDIVYCPKCGTINSFNKSKSGRMLNYFCSRCGLRMNDFWDRYLDGHIDSIKCRKCSQSTFKGSMYCIACGTRQEKAFSDRAGEISEARGIEIELLPSYDGAAMCDAQDFCNCLECCCVLGACIPIQLSTAFTPVLKTTFSVSFVLFAMLQTSFYILFFYSYIRDIIFYSVFSIGLILTILVPIIIYKIQTKNKISKKNQRK
ncbi:MAG: hypothetical protein ACTSO7_05960 [Candidatus Heimdallarchaeota archaeon]